MDADFIIVGGGSAGCVLANRLSADPTVRVLLLEAGGDDRNPLYHWPAGFAKMTKGMGSWGFSTVPQRHLKGRVLWYTQARVIGGGSSINAQLYNRGAREDFDGWAAGGCEGWSYAEVLPYFRRAEGHEHLGAPYHNTDGPLGVAMPRGALPVCEAFIDAAEGWGMPRNTDFNGVHQIGAGYYQLTQRDARRSSTATAYLRPAQRRPNLRVVMGARATRLVLEKGRATGVAFRRKGRSITAHADREVILTAGAIGSPRLLMLSGIGPADHLRTVGVEARHDLSGVGANLSDHLDLCAVAECTGPHSYDGCEQPHRAAWAALRYLATRGGPVVSSLFETGGFWYTGEADSPPDLQFHFGQGSGIEKGIVRIDGHGVTLNSAYLTPASRGTVRLADADPATPPLIDPNYWAEPEDRVRSLRGLEIAREILARPELKPFIRREVLPGPEVRGEEALIDYACRLAKTDHHPVGTCAMGRGAEAVVTPDLRLHGVEGLRVCDASVMPVVPRANTNAATIMIAEKAADLIRGCAPLPPAILE